MTDEHSNDVNRNQRRADDRRSNEPGTMTHTEPVESARPNTVTEPVSPEGNDAGSRMSPETMRTEPVESQRTSRQMDYWPEMAQYRQRFEQMQARFIEEPREAVMEAEKLVEEAIDKMTSSMRERIRGMHRDAETGDTERLRLAMKSLRDFIESMGGRRAA